MDNKKTWAVFCIATLMALIIVFGVYIFMKKTDAKTSLPSVTIENKTSLFDIEDAKQTVSEETVTEPVIKQSVSQVKKSNTTATSQNTPKQKEIPLIQVEEAVVEQPAQNPSVYKDSNTNDIVITTEYKMTSPSKYSFK